MIRIPPSLMADLLDHARSDAPLEACGLLAGSGSDVQRVYRLTNVDASSEHFSLDPKEQFDAARDMRASGLDLVGIYHSHPATPARMSAEDLRLAFTPGVHYVILSLADPARPATKSFLVVDDTPIEEDVLVQE